LERKNRERFKDNHVVKSVSGNSLIAQCPFIYSKKSGQWLLENAIIVGCDNKKKEKMTQINLSNFDGSIKILEIEKETSYINQIFVQVIHNNNDTIIYIPTEKSLIYDDKNYLILDQHESIIIDFTPNFNSEKIKDITLFAKGYYEPYSFDFAN